VERRRTAPDNATVAIGVAKNGARGFATVLIVLALILATLVSVVVTAAVGGAQDRHRI